MNGLFGTIALITGICTFAVLVRNGYTERGDITGWIGATFCTIGGLLTLTGVIAETGQLASAATTLLVLVTLAALIGGVLWWMRNRPAPAFDDRTQTKPKPTQYVHAYGTYDASTVQAARQQAAQIRRGVKA